MAQYRRRNFLINKPFQLKFSFYVVSWIFVLSIIFPIIIYNIYDFLFKYLALDPQGPQIAIVQETRRNILLQLGTLQLVFFIFIFVLSIFISHRIAGPLYKLGKVMKEAKDGRLEAVKFRSKDYFPELAETFSDLALNLKQKHLNTIQTLTQTLSQVQDESLKVEIKKRIEELKPVETVAESAPDTE
jgi:sensor histidine kinase YesM